MNLVPEFYLQAASWQRLPADVFFSRYEGDDTVYPEGADLSSSVYRPVSMVPREIFVRTSEREKRLEFELKAKKIASGGWGSLFDVSGAGSQVGIVLIPAPIFIGCHAMPDVIHLLGNSDTVAYDAIVKDIYVAKAIRAFSISSSSDAPMPEELVLTTKFRWFRNRLNPKHLGFSKEEK